MDAFHAAEVYCVVLYFVGYDNYKQCWVMVAQTLKEIFLGFYNSAHFLSSYQFYSTPQGLN